VLKINQAFINSFKDAGFFDKERIAQENMNFIPPKDGMYAEIMLIENDVTPATLAGDVYETDGLFRVILRSKAGGGAVETRAMSDKITAFYSIGKVIEYDAQRVVIRKFGETPGESRDGWYVYIINIYYKAYTRRDNNG
jgi:hypothetical protein